MRKICPFYDWIFFMIWSGQQQTLDFSGIFQVKYVIIDHCFKISMTPFLSLIYNFSMKIWHNLRFLIIHFETLMYKSCILFSVLQLKTCPTLTCIWSAMLLEYAGKAPVIARDTPLWQIYCFPKLPPHVTGRQTLWILVCKAYSLFEIINRTL